MTLLDFYILYYIEVRGPYLLAQETHVLLNIQNLRACSVTR